MNIAIIGCGYLGKGAAAHLKHKGHTITATTRSSENLEELATVAQRCVVLKGSDEEEFAALLMENDLLLVTVAADSPEHYESAYLHTSQHLKKLATELNTPKQLIYTSSTSVYGDHHGRWVDENSELKPSTEQTKILIETEKNYLSLLEHGWQVCILRLAEIYGPGRELSSRVQSFHGRTLAGAGDFYSNMVHKTDCIEVIDYAIRHRLEGVYNVCDDEHPKRKELYDAISHKFHLALVKWDEGHTPLRSGNKRISNHKIKSEGFAFHYPHRALD